MSEYRELIASFKELDDDYKKQEIISSLNNLVGEMDELLKSNDISQNVNEYESHDYSNIENDSEYLLYVFSAIKKIESQIFDYVSNKN